MVSIGRRACSVAILGAMESRKLEYSELRGKFDGIKV